MESLVLAHYRRDRLDEIRKTLLNIYAEIYRKEISEDPFFSMERFEDRLERHTQAPHWEAVVGDLDGEVVGYAYGFGVRPGGWWGGLRTPIEDQSLIEETGDRTFGLAEIMVRLPWRGTGVAYQIHEELLRSRREERASLLVERAHPKVRAVYEKWGYRWFGEMLPFPDAPLYDAMIRPLR